MLVDLKITWLNLKLTSHLDDKSIDTVTDLHCHFIKLM